MLLLTSYDLLSEFLFFFISCVVFLFYLPERELVPFFQNFLTFLTSCMDTRLTLWMADGNGIYYIGFFFTVITFFFSFFLCFACGIIWIG